MLLLESPRCFHCTRFPPHPWNVPKFQLFLPAFIPASLDPLPCSQLVILIFETKTGRKNVISKKKKNVWCQAWWHTFVISASWRLRQEAGEFEANLRYIMRPCLKESVLIIFKVCESRHHAVYPKVCNLLLGMACILDLILQNTLGLPESFVSRQQKEVKSKTNKQKTQKQNGRRKTEEVSESRREVERKKERVCSNK